MTSRNTNHVSRFTPHASLLILTAILLVGGYLRFTNLHWDEGLWIHPDEAHMQNTLGAIHTPDSLSLYFDTHNSPLNVRNNQDRRYSYGTLPLFVARITTEWLDRACGESPDILSVAVASLFVGPPDADSTILCHPGTFTGGRGKQVGRALSGLADLGTLALIYLIGRRLYAESVGLLAAGLGALTAFSIQQAHFFTVDSMACFFTILTVYFSVRAGQSGSWASFALAGLATGLAGACKVSAAPAALLVVLAVVWRWTQSLPRSLAPLLLRLFLAGLFAIIAFRIAQPYAFEGPGFFGLRPSPEWFERLGQIAHEQSGEVDLPSGRQWANRAAILFPLKDILFWGMGLPLGLAACAGWALAGIELWRGKRVHLVLWGWGTLLFLYHGTRWVKTMRTFLPLYPLLAILAAYFLIRLIRQPRLSLDIGHWTLNLGHWILAICL
ncbi:MAG: glycosyltransferase family 39 protein, partial [Chloroflexota bacterium]|nr:glycosyltransferase family 39 protein [Chloroflexota bacterium]